MKSYSEYKLLKEVGESPDGGATPAAPAASAGTPPMSGGMPDPVSGMPPIGGGGGVPDLGGGGGMPDLGGLGGPPAGGGDPNSSGPTLKINYNNVWDSIDKFLRKVSKDLKKS